MTDEWNPDDPDATRVLYDLGSWSFDQQAELASDLAEADIPHTWDGADLVVPEAFEAQADAAITIVEQRLGIVYPDAADGAGPEGGDDDDGDGDDGDDGDDDAAATEPAPQPIDIPAGTAATEYDLAEWQEGDRQSITRALTRQRIPYRWEDDLLLVPTDHENVVESLMDMIENGEFASHPDDIDDDDERLPFETLTTFFLAGERLQRNPLDANGLELLLAAVEVAEPTKPPYGVDPRLWQRTCELADELAGALVDDDEPDHDAAMAVAADLHDLLRPFV